MDKIELTAEDIDRLLAWRDQHREEVRSHPAPLKAVEIVIPSTGWHIKGIRDGPHLRLYLNQKGKRLGHCEFIRRVDGMWASTKNRMQVGEDELRSVQTVYCSLMALMAYGSAEKGEPGPTRKTATHQPTKAVSGKKKNRTTYILRTVNGALLAAPRGSHASPSGIFTVRGHYRHYKSGKVVWVAEYRKGEGKKKGKIYKIGGGKSGI